MLLNIIVYSAYTKVEFTGFMKDLGNRLRAKGNRLGVKGNETKIYLPIINFSYNLYYKIIYIKSLSYLYLAFYIVVPVA